MACPAVLTGNQFLERTLAHLDCQAQTLGSFGFQTLAGPGSPAFAVLTALLTLFVAVYAVRLLFQPGDEARDLAGAAIKVGIVLTLALSWPAWRVLAYDTVLHGPAEVASAALPNTVPNPRSGFAERLQAIDSGIAALTFTGTGRQNGAVLDTGPTSGFRQVALADETGLGWSRTLFLASTIGSLATVRIAGGLLLALAPLFAGLLLFEATRGLFAGYLRALVLVAMGSLGVTVLLAVEIAVLEPWLADAVNRRNLGYAVPTAPTEILALVLAFAVAALLLLGLLARIAFQQGWSGPGVMAARRVVEALAPAPRYVPVQGRVAEIAAQPRPLAISESVAQSMRRESERFHTLERIREPGPVSTGPAAEGLARGSSAQTAEPLGSSYRRNYHRGSASRQTRDSQP